MKRFITLVVLFCTLGFNIFSNENINFFTPEVEHKATWAFNSNSHNNFYTYTLGTSAMVQADMKELVVTNGLEFYYSGFNFTNDITYAPTLFNVWNLGVRMINHLNCTYNTYFENDFLIGFSTRLQPVPAFYFSASVLFQNKNTFIFDLSDSRKVISNTCPAVELLFDYKPLDWLDFTLSISSFTLTRYYLFFSPVTRLNVEFKVNPFLYIGFGGEIQYVDFFTLSANLDRISTNINFSWRF